MKLAAALVLLAAPAFAQIESNPTTPGVLRLGPPGGIEHRAAAAETCEDWGMRDFEADRTEYFEVADPWARADVSFAWAVWAIAESSGTMSVVGQVVGGDFGFNIYWTAAKAEFRVGTGGGAWACTANASTFGALSINTLYFVYGYYDSVASECYVSVNAGALDSGVAGVVADSTTSLMFGNNGAAQKYDGRSGPNMRFTTPPSAGEVATLYNSGFRLNCSDADAALSTGVMSHCWMLDEASGNALESAVTGNGVDLLDINTVGSANACIP